MIFASSIGQWGIGGVVRADRSKGHPWPNHPALVREVCDSNPTAPFPPDEIDLELRDELAASGRDDGSYVVMLEIAQSAGATADSRCSTAA